MRKLLVLGLTLAVLGAACSGSSSDESSTRVPSSSTSPEAGNEPASGCGVDGQPDPGTERLEVTDDGPNRGGLREIERVIPDAYDGTTPQPLILSLHGFTSNIDQIDLFSGLPAAADSRGFVLLTPQALPATLPIGDTEIDAPFWNVLPEQTKDIDGVHDDIGFLLGLIDDTVSDLCIDPDRIYVTGNSNGAGMAAALACAGPGRFAAIAPVSGINLAGTCDDLAPVSVITFHGDADPLVDYEGGSAVSAELDVPSVPDQAGAFASAAGCDPGPATSKPYEDIEETRWSACAPGLDVELYTVLGGGHTWPGMLNYVDPARLSALGDTQKLAEVAGVDLAEIAGHMTTSIEATNEMLDFFEAHPRP